MQAAWGSGSDVVRVAVSYLLAHALQLQVGHEVSRAEIHYDVLPRLHRLHCSDSLPFESWLRLPEQSPGVGSREALLPPINGWQVRDELLTAYTLLDFDSLPHPARLQAHTSWASWALQGLQMAPWSQRATINRPG